MRKLDECRAEVFRRSENRIIKRKKNRRRVIACCAPLILFVTVWSATSLPGILSGADNDKVPGEPYVNVSGDNDGTSVNNGGNIYVEPNDENKKPSDYIYQFFEVTGNTDESEFGSLDSFSFELIIDEKNKRNYFYYTSYDSLSGKYVHNIESPSQNVYYKEENDTTYCLTEKEKKYIYDFIYDMDVMEYPDEYIIEGEEDEYEISSHTYILTVKTDKFEKTINLKYALLNDEDSETCEKMEEFVKDCDTIRYYLSTAVRCQEENK